MRAKKKFDVYFPGNRTGWAVRESGLGDIRASASAGYLRALLLQRQKSAL
jgi:hypothetical protein